jgi:pyrroloquinoline quinone (PQQ) biosynthesis protein C
LLTPYAGVQDNGDTLEINDGEFAYEFSSRSASVVRAVLHRLDGTHTLASLAELARVPAPEMAATLNVLTGGALLIDADTAIHAQDPESFLTGLKLLSRFWLRDIFAQPFWTRVRSGEASDALILGWGLEFYHYVEAANEHMALGVAHCHLDPRARQWMSQHYVEEYDHAGIFLDGLVACGYDREEITEARPLPSTRGLINYLNELAMEDTLAYLGTYAVMHAPSETGNQEMLTAFYRQLGETYPNASGLINAFQKHALIDTELEHKELVLERLYRQGYPYAPDHPRRILRAARGAAECFALFFEGIHDHYRDMSILTTRRPANVSTL